MTTTTDDELLALAEAAIIAPKTPPYSAVRAYLDAASPERVIALLETIKDLRAELRGCSR